MRIIAGQRRGLQLASLPGRQTRPTSDRVREAIFSSLMYHLPDARVLDLFAGTGALGLEALSRGAEEAVFCEKHPQTLAVLQKNIMLVNLPGARLMRGDALDMMRQDRIQALFDIIFLDPPYAADLYETALALIADKHLLAENGIIVAEHAKNTFLSATYDVFLIDKTKKYGDTCVSYLVSRESTGRHM